VAGETIKSGKPAYQAIEVSHPTDVSIAQREVKTKAKVIGFDDLESEEIALAARELASNLVRHAGKGRLLLAVLTEGERRGIQIESVDNGPGIKDVDLAVTDGYSTAGSLGYGLGTVNRLMVELDITSGRGEGTHIVCRRWVPSDEPSTRPCPLTFGAASRPHPKMEVNGDAFIIKKWGESVLVGIIDGLGHGQFAHRAAQTARRYMETHFDQPLAEIFRSVSRGCRPTRGVVMALARFDWGKERLLFASIGNIEARVFDSSKPVKLLVRRGIVGLNAPNPVVTEHDWDPRSVMVIHSDGLRTHWRWEDFADLKKESATVIAEKLLRTLAKDEDDATVVVVKGAEDEIQ
jgi:anti-sigma regulatory factor (Ser/Thr protein kinase)/serine/threonine protein phosphatase PrpC